MKLLISLVVAAAAAGAILANVLLLGSAASDNAPVGRLSPRAHLPPRRTGRSGPRQGRRTTGTPTTKQPCTGLWDALVRGWRAGYLSGTVTGPGWRV